MLEGYDYLILSSLLYLRYFNEPSRYTHEVHFYKTLFEEGNLIRTFRSMPTRGGLTIHIFKLGE